MMTPHTIFLVNVLIVLICVYGYLLTTKAACLRDGVDLTKPIERHLWVKMYCSSHNTIKEMYTKTVWLVNHPNDEASKQLSNEFKSRAVELIKTFATNRGIQLEDR
jgi:hypothetical protein